MGKWSCLACECKSTTKHWDIGMKGPHKSMSTLTARASEPHSESEAIALACSALELHKIWRKRFRVRESMRWCWACLTWRRMSVAQACALLSSTETPPPFPVDSMGCFSDVGNLCCTGTHDEEALSYPTKWWVAPFSLPSLSDAPLDLKIKASMISDMFTVVGK